MKRLGLKQLSLDLLNKKGIEMENYYKVKRHPNYKSRWMCEIFTANLKDPNKGCDFGRKFTSRKKAEAFGEYACDLLNKKETE